MNIQIDNSAMELMMRSLFTEFMENNRELFKELIIESIEDIGMMKAIQEADENEFVSEDSIMKLLAV